MKLPLAADYKKLTLRGLNTDEFRHLKLLLFWPVFGIMFLFVERFYELESYYSVHCFVDDLIPFHEIFLIPYLFWFIYMVGMHLYTLLYDIPAFRRLMYYIIFTFSVTTLIYLLFPTCQELRPAEFLRNNALTRFIAGFYQFDTNTNVCPSLHVIGSMAVLSTALHAKTIKSKGCKAAFCATAVLICLSTVFMKQHSVIDVLCGLPLCLIAEWICKKAEKREIQERRILHEKQHLSDHH